MFQQCFHLSLYNKGMCNNIKFVPNYTLTEIQIHTNVIPLETEATLHTCDFALIIVAGHWHGNWSWSQITDCS